MFNAHEFEDALPAAPQPQILNDIQTTKEEKAHGMGAAVARAVATELPEGALETAGVVSSTILQKLQGDAHDAVTAGSFGTAGLLNMVSQHIAEKRLDEAPDLAFQAQLKDPKFYDRVGARDVPFDIRRDELDSSPNFEVFSSRLQRINARRLAEKEISMNVSAQNIGAVAGISEYVAAMGAGPLVVGTALKAGTFATRMAMGAGIDVATGGAVELGQAAARNEQIEAGDFAANMAINGIGGALGNGLHMADFAKAKELFIKTKAQMRGVKPLTEAVGHGDDLGRDMAHGAPLEPLREGGPATTPTAAPKGPVAPVEPGVSYAPKTDTGISNGSYVADTVAPTGTVSSGLKATYRQAEDLRIKDPASVHLEAPLTVPHPEVVADALRGALQADSLKASIRSAQDYLRTMPNDLESLQKTLQNEAAWEAHLGLNNMPEGWLTNGSPAKATATAMRAKMAQDLEILKAGGTGSKNARLITQLEGSLVKQEAILKSLDQPRLIDPTGEVRTDGILDVHAAAAPTELHGAKPVYSIEGSKYTPKFDSLVDKALYMVGQAKASFHDVKYMDYLKGVFPQLDEVQIREFGSQVNSHGVRPVADVVPVGERPRWKESADLRIPNFWQDNVPLTKAEKVAATEVPVEVKEILEEMAPPAPKVEAPVAVAETPKVEEIKVPETPVLTPEGKVTKVKGTPKAKVEKVLGPVEPKGTDYWPGGAIPEGAQAAYDAKRAAEGARLQLEHDIEFAQDALIRASGKNPKKAEKLTKELTELNRQLDALTAPKTVGDIAKRNSEAMNHAEALGGELRELNAKGASKETLAAKHVEIEAHQNVLDGIREEIMQVGKEPKAVIEAPKVEPVADVSPHQVGDAVVDAVFREAIVVKVNAKSLMIETPSGFRTTRKLSFILENNTAKERAVVAKRVKAAEKAQEVQKGEAALRESEVVQKTRVVDAEPVVEDATSKSKRIGSEMNAISARATKEHQAAVDKFIASKEGGMFKADVAHFMTPEERAQVAALKEQLPTQGELQGEARARIAAKTAAAKAAKGDTKAELQRITDELEALRLEHRKILLGTPEMERAASAEDPRLVAIDLKSAELRQQMRNVMAKGKQAGFSNVHMMTGLAGASALGMYLYDPEAFAESAGVAGLGLAGIMIGPKGAKSLSASLKEWAHVEPALHAAQALKAAGKDMESIRQETGWFEHPADQQWRFELSDSEMQIGDLGGKLKAVKKGMAKEVGPANPAGEAFVKDNPEIVSAMERYWRKKPGTVQKWMDEGSDDHYLNQAMSQYRDMGLEFAHYKAIDNYMRTDGLKAIRAEKELFTYRTPTVPLTDLISHEALRAAYPELKGVGVKQTKSMDTDGAFAAARDGGVEGSSLSLSSQAFDPKSTLLHETQHAVQRVEGFPRGGSPAEFPKGVDSNGTRLTPHDSYKRLAGEAEARLAQTRMGLSQDELKARNPLDDLDVPLNELIVKFGHDTPMLSQASPQEAARALEEFNKNEGWKAFGALRPGVVLPSGALVLPETGKVAFTGVNFKLPFTEKELDVRVGFMPADYIGSSKANSARAVGDLLMNNAVGKKALGGGSALVEPSADVLKIIHVDAHMGQIQKHGMDLMGQWMMDTHGIGMSQVNDFKMAHVVDFNRAWSDAFRGVDTVQPFMREGALKSQKVVQAFHGDIVTMRDAMGVDVKNETSMMNKAANITPDDMYLSRQWDQAQRLDISAKIGEAGVVSILAKSLRDVDPSLSEAYATARAKGVMMALDSAEEGMHTRLSILDQQRIRQTMLDGGSSSEDVEIALGILTGKAVGPDGKVLKDRITLNERMDPMEFTLADGSKQSYTVRDLFVNDPTTLWHGWFNTMAGLQALGQVSKRVGMDLTDDKVWNLFKKQMKAEGAKPREIELLDAQREHTLGRGGEKVWQPGSKLGGMVRSWASARYGMWFGVNQLAEFGKALPEAQMSRFIENMPGVSDLLATGGKGQFNAGKARDIANFTGQGYDHIGPYLQQGVEQGLDGATETYRNSDMAIHKIMAGNGFYASSDAVKGFAANNAMSKLYDASMGNLEIPEGQWKHWAVYGIDKARFELMKPLLQKHVEVDNLGVITGFNHKAALAENYDLSMGLASFLRQVGSDASSEALGTGQRLPFATSEVGRFALQFMAPSIVGWQRLRRDLVNFDSQIAARWVSSFSLAAAVYVARTYLDNVGDEESRDKKLKPHAIFMGALRNSSFATFMPNIVSGASAFTPWADPTADASNSGRINPNTPPVLSAVAQAQQSIKDVITGTLSTDAVITKSQANKAIRHIQPFFWLKPIMGALTSGLEDKQPVQPQQQH